MMYLVFHNSHSVFVLIKHAAFNLGSGVFLWGGGGRGWETKWEEGHLIAG